MKQRPSEAISLVIHTATGAVWVQANLTWDVTRSADWAPPTGMPTCDTVLSWCYVIESAQNLAGNYICTADLAPYRAEIDAEVIRYIETNLHT